MSTIRLATPIRVAGFGLGAFNIGWDLYQWNTGGETRNQALGSIGLTLYGATGPMAAITALGLGSIEAFYPGGWSGNGSNIPYNGAGALSDYGTTIMMNRAVVPDWKPREPGP